MLKFLFALVLLVHGCFALAVQHYFPATLAGVFAPKKAAALHSVFPAGLYPPAPVTLRGYLLASAQVVAGFLLLKSLTRL